MVAATSAMRLRRTVESSKPRITNFHNVTLRWHYGWAGTHYVRDMVSRASGTTCPTLYDSRGVKSFCKLIHSHLKSSCSIDAVNGVTSRWEASVVCCVSF